MCVSTSKAIVYFQIDVRTFSIYCLFYFFLNKFFYHTLKHGKIEGNVTYATDHLEFTQE